MLDLPVIFRNKHYFGVFWWRMTVCLQRRPRWYCWAMEGMLNVHVGPLCIDFCYRD